MDVEQLRSYIESHPDDFARRWKLAKKLYMACEYADVLGHLQILKEQWTPKVNVCRYLAAAYYRLGRYEEAIAELEDAVSTWPTELPLRKQLAKVLESRGERERAMEIWSELLKLDPNDSAILPAIERLRKPPGKDGAQDHAAGDSGFDLAPVIVCSQCGTRNDYENESCWQCFAPLVKPAEPITNTPTPRPRRHEKPASSLWIWVLVSGTLTTVFVAADVFMSLTWYVRGQEAAAWPGLYAFFATEFLGARVLIGAALFIGWPIVLKLAAAIFEARDVPPVVTPGIGLLLGSGTALLLWAPMALLPLVLILPLVGSFALIASAMRVHFREAIRIWLFQALLITALCAGCVFPVLQVEGIAALPKVVQFSISRGMTGSTEPVSIASVRLPAQENLVWRSSGTSWLDERAERATITLSGPDMSVPLDVLCKRSGRTIYETVARSLPHRFTLDIAPGAYYQLVLRGPEGAPVNVSVLSILPVQAQ